MKKLFILTFALFTINLSNAQWFPQNSGTTNDLNSVFFTSNQTGFAVGEIGTILKTVNGGINWSLVPGGTTADLSSVYFLDELTGYITGGGVVLKTLNGGESWDNTNADTNYFYTDVHFPSAGNGYITGTRSFPWPILNVSIVYKTSDGGANWDSVFYAGGQLLSVFFPSEDTGYVAGWWGGMPNAGVLHRTIDSGNSWDECGAQTYTVFRSLQFLDNNTGYWVSSNYGSMSGTPRLYKTINGGTTFSFTGLMSGEIPKDIYFHETGIGFVVGYNEDDWNGIIVKTSDDWLNWSTQCIIQNNICNSIYFPSPDTGYVVGTNGIIYQTTNGGVTGTNEEIVASNNFKIIPNPSKDKISISLHDVTSNTQLSIFNVSGGKVLERQLVDNTAQLDISALPRGMYFVRVQNEKMTELTKLLKQ